MTDATIDDLDARRAAYLARRERIQPDYERHTALLAQGYSHHQIMLMKREAEAMQDLKKGDRLRLTYPGGEAHDTEVMEVVVTDVDETDGSVTVNFPTDWTVYPVEVQTGVVQIERLT